MITLYTRRLYAAAVLMTVFALLLTACAGMQAQQPPPDPDFLGNFDPIRLEDAVAVRSVFGKLKPTAIRMYFVPRTNIVEAHLRDGINSFVLMFTREERTQFAGAVDTYAALYSAYHGGDHSALPDRAPSQKNIFNRASVSVAWGVLGTAYNAKTAFRTNYHFLEKGKPYFMLTIEPADDTGGSGAQSPVLHLYFTPKQLENLLASTRQDVLQAQVDELNRNAFDF